MRRISNGATYFLLIALTSGCGSDDPGDSCVAPPGCDITNQVCQRSIFRATACEREQTDATAPPVRTLTVDAFATELDARKKDLSSNDATWETAYHLLGLLARNQGLQDATNAAAVAGVAAYYDTDDKNITVIQRDETDPTNDVFVLSHEFVHALQDQKTDIRAFEKKWTTGTDSQVAVRSLVEGEAVVLSLQVYAHALGRVVSWSGLSASLFDSIFEALDASTAPLPAALGSLTYPVGAGGLVEPYLAQGIPGIAAYFDAPRVSLLDWDTGVEPPETSVVPMVCFPTVPPAGYAALDHDTLGMAGMVAASVLATGSSKTGYDDARAWRNDVLVTYGVAGDTTNENRAVAWRTEWATAADAATFANVARSLSSETRIVSKDRAVTVFAATDAAVLAAWDTEACGAESDLPSPPADDSSPMMGNSLRRPFR